MLSRLVLAVFDLSTDEIDSEFGFAVRLIPPFFGLLFVGIEEKPIGDEGHKGFVPIFVQLFLPVLVLCVVEMSLTQRLKRYKFVSIEGENESMTPESLKT